VEAGYPLRKPIPGDSRQAHGFDTNKNGPTSLFYLPSQPGDPSGTYFRHFREEGRMPLDPQQWVEKVLAEEQAVPFIETPMEETWHGGLGGSAVNQDWVDRAIEEWRVADHTRHEDNHNFFILALKLTSAGCDEPTIRQNLTEEAQSANTPEDRIKQIPSIFSSLRNRQYQSALPNAIGAKYRLCG
jgi:hypothetical protein